LYVSENKNVEEYHHHSLFNWLLDATQNPYLKLLIEN